MTRTMPLDEVIWRLGNALRTGRLTDWQRGFAASIAKNMKRASWEPSDRQEWAMRKIVDELAVPDGDLIDRVETMEMTMETSDPAH